MDSEYYTRKEAELLSSKKDPSPKDFKYITSDNSCRSTYWRRRRNLLKTVRYISTSKYKA